jgi:hypothetical protein
MDSSKEHKRTVLPFGKPVPIAKDTKEILLNTYGNIRAEIDHGVAIIQTKKLKGNQREVARINTNATPPTIEFAIEEVQVES